MSKQFEDLFEAYSSNMTIFPDLYDELAKELNVSSSALQMMDVGCDPSKQSWAFAERDGRGDIIGITMRSRDGKKFMVSGSKRGLTFVLNPGAMTGENRYMPGRHRWKAVTKANPCPVCGKDKWCMVSETRNPAAALCTKISEGSIKKLEAFCAWLHVLRPEATSVFNENEVLVPSALPILVLEGFSDVAAATTLGFTAVGRPNDTGKMELLTSLPLAKKEIVIIGENDAGAGVRGMKTAYHNLKKLSNRVKMMMPPEGVKDLRKWLTAGLTQQELLDYINTNAKGEEEDVLEECSPSKLARAFLDEHSKGETTLLRSYLGKWVEFNGRFYEEVDEKVLRGQLYAFLDDKEVSNTNNKGEVKLTDYAATRNKVNDILDAMCQWCPVKREAPFWMIKGDNLPPIDRTLPFENGVLDLDEYIYNNNVKMHDPTDVFSVRAFPYKFDEDAGSKLWGDFLVDIFDDDSERIMLLSQWFGYNCVPDMTFEKMMWLIGVSRSGKGTTVNCLRGMLGNSQCADTSYASIAGDFGYAPLVDKLSAVIGDSRTPARHIVSNALEALLRITGGDFVSINRKFKDHLTSVSLKCRFTIAANDIPLIMDYSKSLLARANIIRFNKSFVGREDWSLKRRLTQEAKSGKLINFALAGLKELARTNSFVVPESSLSSLQNFLDTTSPISAFIEECCEISTDPEAVVPKVMMFDAWRGWCEERNLKPGSYQSFCTGVTSTASYITVTRKRVNGRAEYVFGGARLQKWVYSQYLGRPK